MYVNRGRETLESGVVSELKMHIVLQRKLSIVINLFSSRFMAIEYLTLLCHYLTFTCVPKSLGSLPVVVYVFETL